MAIVLRKPQAEADLIEIWIYIAQDSPTSADKLLDEINEKSQTLAVSPFIGITRDELGPHIRSFPIGNYVLFYQPIVEGIENAEQSRILMGMGCQFGQGYYYSKPQPLDVILDKFASVSSQKIS